MKDITKDQFLKEIEKRWHGAPVGNRNFGNNYAARGAKYRYNIARQLYDAIKRGYKPTRRETAGYFGKGAQFVG